MFESKSYSAIKFTDKYATINYNDQAEYQSNPRARVLFWIISWSIFLLLGLTAYNGGIKRAKTFDDFEDMEFWHQLWNSSIPFWSVLIANLGILFISVSVITVSKTIFLNFPKKPLCLLIIGTMSVSALVFFLHPSDDVFYPGMFMVLIENYFWLLLMIKPDDFLARLMHPYLHSSNQGGVLFNFRERYSRGNGRNGETDKILKSVKITSI